MLWDKSDIQSLLSEKELQRAALRIRELVPIDIFTLSDRIGNIIFQRKVLSSGSNQLGINLHWQAQHGMFGFAFHDRFLIHLPSGETPRAWSLGISVNGLGKSHHIMQLVFNPGYVVDAFEELWGALGSLVSAMEQ